MHSANKLSLPFGSKTQYSVARRSSSMYNEYATNLMQWAYSASTQIGDVKIFNNNGKNFVLLKATENGPIELISGNYAEVKKLEEEYRQIDITNDSVYVYSSTLWNGEAGNIADDGAVENSEKYAESGYSTTRTGLQSDTSRSNEHLRSGDRGEYSESEAGLEESAFSMPEDSVQHSINLPTKKEFNAEEYANNLARAYNKKANKQQLEQAITEIEQGIVQKDFRVAEDASKSFRQTLVLCEFLLYNIFYRVVGGKVCILLTLKKLPKTVCSG